MPERKHTFGILLDTGNIEEIAYYADISLGSAGTIVARELKYTERENAEKYWVFGYVSPEGVVHDDWVFLSMDQIEHNFEFDHVKIRSEIVKMYYKNN